MMYVVFKTSKSSYFVLRFGLYGNPLEPELFDLEPPQLVKASSVSPTTYASAVNNNNNNNPVATVTTLQQEEIDFKDLMTLTADKTSQKSQGDHVTSHICGLLEVEPLHFSCHATSDGTRMERMDTGLFILNA